MPSSTYTAYPEKVQLLVSSFPILEKEPSARKLMLCIPQQWSLGCCTAARSACGMVTRYDQALAVRIVINTTANQPAVCQALYRSMFWNYTGLCEASLNLHLVIHHFVPLQHYYPATGFVFSLH